MTRTDFDHHLLSLHRGVASLAGFLKDMRFPSEHEEADLRQHVNEDIVRALVDLHYLELAADELTRREGDR